MLNKGTIRRAVWSVAIGFSQRKKLSNIFFTLKVSNIEEIVYLTSIKRAAMERKR